MNLGFIVSKDVVVVIDCDHSDAMPKVMLTQMQRITYLPVHFVIKTDSAGKSCSDLLGNRPSLQLGQEFAPEMS